MTGRAGLLLSLSVWSLQAHGIAAQNPPQVASLGVCRLASGQAVPDCRVAYRVFGKLNATRSNVVLIPTWALGRSEEWIPLLGPDGVVDTADFFVVVADALGNGSSSSPSNTGPPGREAFGGLTIGDMVESQRRLLREHLGITHLRAVLGFSMGGMQAFEWAARYPRDVDMAIPIAGSPRVGTFDRLLWTVFLEEVENGRRAGTAPSQIWGRVSRLLTLFRQTPTAVNQVSWDSVQAQIRAEATVLTQTWELDDFAAQLRAIRQYDISGSAALNLGQVAAGVRARMLIIASPEDYIVTAGSSRAFAPLVHADTLWVTSTCGHAALFCERQAVATAVRRFMSP